MKVKMLLVFTVLVCLLTAAPGIYQKKQFAVDATNWTAIVTPMACNSVGIKNTSDVDMLLRTDSNDATTEDTLPTLQIEVIASLLPQPQGGRATRFIANETILYVKMSSGTGTATASFLR